MKNEEILQLVDEIKQGNKRAESKLYTKIHPFINLMCNSFGKTKEDVEDLVSESFIKIFQNINEYNTEYAFLTWAGKITKNHCLNFIRSKSFKIIELTQNYDNSIYEAPSLLNDDILNKDVNDCFGSYDIQQCLNKLNPREKQIIELVSQGYSDQELYDIFPNLDPRYIRVIIWRARKKMKDNLLQLEKNKNNNQKLLS